MFRIAVCDDEECFRETVKKYVGDYLIKKEVSYEIDTYSSGKDLLELSLDVVKYTVIFLDINMEGIDGIKTAKKIREYSSDVYIVFVTAYIDYSLEGYKVDAARYLLKNNINLEDSIYECMDAILEKINHIVLIRKFTFNGCEKNVPFERIVYIESKLHKLEFHIMEERMMTYTIYETLNVLEKELQKYGFLRIHQSFLVNLQHIKKVTSYYAVLNNGQRLPIPKARYREVKNAFIAYIGEV